MERSDVLGVYDDQYAADYDDRFLSGQWAGSGADFEESLLRELLTGDDPRWLDVACGTGWFLSRFAGVPRAGLDISPAMLERARSANPDALFVREGDFRHDVAEWHGSWSVVSCMWTAYNYVQSMPELDGLVENIVRWVRPGGAAFIPVMDLEDLRYVQVPYEADPEVWGGTIALTGCTWTWDEPATGKRHEHLIAPHVEHFIRLLEPHFEHIRVARYPLVVPGGIARKALVATGRRTEANPGLATISFDPLPEGAHDAAAWQSSIGADVATVRAEIVELRQEIAALHGAVASLHHEVGAVHGQANTVVGNLLRPGGSDDDRYDIVGVIHEQVAGIRTELAQLSERLGGGAPPAAQRARTLPRRVASRAKRTLRR